MLSIHPGAGVSEPRRRKKYQTLHPASPSGFLVSFEHVGAMIV
jgi:hypothetical protein